MLNSRRIALFAFALAVAIWVMYCYNPFLLWFQNDDFSHLLLSKQGILFQKNSFRPVCDLSIMLDYYLWGNNPVGYHVTNLVLHATCAALVFIFSRRVFSLYYACKPFYALACGVLFFAYPFHSEAVFWILGRSAILGAIFSLVFLLFFLKDKKSVASTAISLTAYAIALLTYESSWVLPLIALVLSKREEGKPFKASIKQYYWLAAIFIVYLFARIMVNNQLMGIYEGANFLQFNIVILLGNYFKLFAMSFIAYKETWIELSISFYILSAILLYQFVRRPNVPALKLLLCFFVCLLPYLSLGIDTHGTEGERFLYLPSIFTILFTVIVLSSLKKKYLWYIIAGLTVIVYAVQLYFNAVNYRFAGSVVKQTITQMANTPEGKSIVIEGLPKSQHGALILASGLQDAEMLYAPGKNISCDIENWRYELNPLQMPYKTIVLSPQAGSSVIKYVFTDSALLIYR